MKQTIRSFAIGLFSAGVIMLVVHYFTNANTQDLSEVPIEEIIDHVKEDGYRVLSEEEYITLAVNQDNPNETEDHSNLSEEEDEPTESSNSEGDSGVEEETVNEEPATETEEETEVATVHTYTITIESGMTSSVISNELAENNVIDDAGAFSKYLEEQGYSVRIQLGDFTITSDMSHYEIAELITS